MRIITAMYLAATAVVASVVWLITTPAQAHILTGMECQALGRDAGMIAEARDIGLDIKLTSKTMQAQLAKVFGAKDSYIQDDDDIALVMGLIPKIYSSPASVADLRNAVYAGCMAVAERTI